MLDNEAASELVAEEEEVLGSLSVELELVEWLAWGTGLQVLDHQVFSILSATLK